MAGKIAMATHVVTVLCLFAFGAFFQCSVIYFSSAVLVAAMLHMTHRAAIARSEHLEKIFAVSNTYIGLTLLLGALLERIWGV